MAVTTLVAQNFIPELWLPLVQKAREDKLVAAKRFFDISGYGDIRTKGDVVHVPLLSNYTPIAKTANTELPESATTESQFTLTVDTHEGIRIPVEDITKAQSAYGLTEMYTQKIGFGLAESLDTAILGLWSGLSQTVGAAASTDGGISDTVIVAALRKLDAANAPTEMRSMIVDAWGMEDLRLIDKFVRYDAVGQGGASNPIVSGRVGSIYGVDVFQTENLASSSVVGGTLSRGLIAHKEAFAFATQMGGAKMETWRNAPRLQDEVIGQQLYGVAEYRDNHGVVLSYPQA